MSSPLPPEIRRFFWEYEDPPTWPESRDTVIPKLLRDGGEKGLDYLLRVMSDEDLREWLIRQDPRGIPPAQLHRLKRYLSLPGEWVEARVARYQNTIWGRRTDE